MAAPRYPDAPLVEETAPLRPRIAAQRFMEPLAEPGGRIQTRLEIASLSSIASQILAVGYLRVANGGLRPFRISHVPTAGRVLEFTRLSLYPEWEIASMHLVASAGVKRGRQYVRARIVDSLNNPIDSLSAGYVYEGFDLPLGRFVEPGPGGGEGFIRTVMGTDPGASGEEVLETVPANALWRLLAFGVVLVTSADAAMRVPRLVCDDGTTANRLFMLGGANQAASLTRTHLWTRSSNSIADDSANLFADTDTLEVHATIPEGFLSEGYRLRTSTVAIDTTGPAFDNYAAPIFQVEEWLVV